VEPVWNLCELLDEVQEGVDSRSCFDRVAKPLLAMDLVVVSAPLFVYLKVASTGELRHDPLNRPLCDSDLI